MENVAKCLNFRLLSQPFAQAFHQILQMYFTKIPSKFI